MRILLLVTAATVVSFFTPPAIQADEVKIVSTFKGSKPNQADEELMKLAPKDSFIADSKEWAKLWKAWEGEKKLPEVDFGKQLVVVGITSCAANQIGGNLKLDDKGNLQTVFLATRIAGPGFAYIILVVDRAGIKTVNGKPVSID